MSFLEPSEMRCDNQNNLSGLADMAQATPNGIPSGGVSEHKTGRACHSTRCLCALGPSCAVYRGRQVDLLMIPLPDQKNKRSGTEIFILQSCDSTFYVSMHVHSILFCLKTWTDSTTTWLSSFYQMIWANHCQLILLIIVKCINSGKQELDSIELDLKKIDCLSLIIISKGDAPHFKVLLTLWLRDMG